jgi:co-chaperonin GroES (HSP10)
VPDNRSKPQATADDIYDGLGDALDGIQIFHNQILVAVYIRPNVTEGGIHLPDQTIDEDRWQGKVGMVLKKGPIAFLDDPRNSFHGQNVEPGEWVMFRVSEAPAISVNGVHCRLLEDIHVRGVISSPSFIW